MKGFTVDKQFMDLLQGYCQQQSLPIDSMMKNHGYSDEYAHSARLPVSLYFGVMDEAAKRLNDELLGLHLVQQIRISHLGIVGLAQLASGNWQQIMQRVLRFGRLWADIYGDELTVTDDYAQLTQICRLPDEQRGALSHHHAMFNVGMAQALVPTFSAIPLKPIGVGFRAPAVANRAELEAFFGPHLFFDQEHDWIRYSRSELDAAIGGEPDAEAVAMLDAACEDQLRKLSFAGEEDWMRRVRKQIIQELPLGSPVLAKSAEAAGLSVRQLRRYLASAGTNFRTVIDDIRRELAEQYLQDQSLQLVEIAMMLGYTEQSAFQRAYQRWKGCSPGRARK